jgi:hypothetical protein
MHEGRPGGDNSKPEDETLLMADTAEAFAAKTGHNDQYMSLLKLLELDNNGVLQKFVKECQKNNTDFVTKNEEIEDAIKQINQHIEKEASFSLQSRGLLARRSDLNNQLYFRKHAEFVFNWMQAKNKTYEDLREILEKHKQLEKNFANN